MRILYLCLLFFSSFLSFSQARKINAESAIQNVTVFTSGAQINRVANVSVLPGRTEIVFNGLSNQLEQQSLQLKADANITLLSVQTGKDYFSQRKIEQEEKDLLQRQANLTDKNDMDVKLLEVFKNEEGMLIKNQEIADMLKISVHTVKNQKARGLKILKMKLGASFLVFCLLLMK